MFYCFDFFKTNLNSINQDIERSKRDGTFLYYNRVKQKVLDKNKKEVDINGMHILPITGVLQLSKMIEFLNKNGAIIPNNLKDIEMILSWYKYIETNRIIIPFTGRMLEDKSFLTYLIESFDKEEEIFFKTKEKDFHCFIRLEDLINKKSNLRKTISYHLDDEFFVSAKMEIDSDKIGNLEYRSFVYDEKIMNISRNTNMTFHTIPHTVVDFVNETIHNLPDCFPTTFVLDTCISKDSIDILELNPLEASGRYLYNSFFDFSNDLTHSDIENVPIEKRNHNLSYDSTDNLTPSIATKIRHSFAQDYQHIRKLEKLVSGLIPIDELLSDQKTDLTSILENAISIETGQELKTFSKKKTY